MSLKIVLTYGLQFNKEEPIDMNGNKLELLFVANIEF